MKAELIPADGGPPIPITRDVTILGRREYCDVRIDHPSLSKRHCVLVKTDGLLVIRDLATTNGTKVKGQKIRWAALLPEDRISFGSIKFRVYLGPDNVASPSEVLAGGGALPTRKAVARPPAATPAPVSRPVADFDLPPSGLDEAAWRNALSSGIEIEDDDEEIIDLD